MKVITIDSEAYRKLIQKLDAILLTIKEIQEGEKERTKKEFTTTPTNEAETLETLYNNQEVAGLLDISTRTLARLRKNGGISYIRLSGGIRYRFSDIKHFIDKRKIKTKDETNKKMMPLSNIVND